MAKRKNKIARVRYWQWVVLLFLSQFINTFQVRIICVTILLGLLVWSGGHNRKFLENMRKLATFDELTGLYNFRTFHVRLKEETARARRYQTPLLLLIIDADKFKPFNDTFGHGAGNRALQKIALVMKQQMRIEDVLARFGGDEFVCICPGITLEQGKVLAERLREGIADTTFVSVPGELTVSIGLKAYRQGETAEEFFVKADEKLYKGKSNGRNQVYVA